MALAHRRHGRVHSLKGMRRTPLALLLAALVIAACGGGDHLTGAGATPLAGGSATSTGLKLVKVGTFKSPVYVTSPPGDKQRIYVVEQAGRILERRNGRTRTFLDIRGLVTSGGEQGLLSMAFAPDYATSRRFYVYYTDKGSQERVVEYRASSPDKADLGSARLVLRMADPEPNHNGGLLLFGPDRKLYIGFGDGGALGLLAVGCGFEHQLASIDRARRGAARRL